MAMDNETFADFVAEAIGELPRHAKHLLRILDDPDIDEAARSKVAGVLMTLLAASNVLPGLKGMLALMDDAFLLRVVLAKLRAEAPEAFAAYAEDEPSLWDKLDDDVAALSTVLGPVLMSNFDKCFDNLGKTQLKGHTASKCASDEEEATWLYDSIHEALTEQLDLDEEEVGRASRQAPKTIDDMRLRLDPR